MKKNNISLFITKLKSLNNNINELEQTQFNNKTHDDQADATSDAFYWLARGVELPNFSLPDLSSGPTLSLPTAGSIPISGLTIPTNTYR